jgi:NAD(P)H-hydrate epimerase
MMRLLSNEQIRKIDQHAIIDYGIAGLILMENAGLAIVDEIKKRFEPKANILIVSGRGSNGGDGFVVCRHLHNANYAVQLITLGAEDRIRGDALMNFEIVKKMGIAKKNYTEQGKLEGFRELINQADVVVDAILGTGLAYDVSPLYEEAISLINGYSKYTLSIDLPSGVCGDDGLIKKTAIMANVTVCFHCPKCGNILYPGAENNGELIIKDIGIPKEANALIDYTYQIITEQDVIGRMPYRHGQMHKGSFGKAGVVAGSLGLAGAAILTSKAALRSGLGLLKLFIPESINALIKTAIPESITIPLQEMRKGVIGINQIAGIVEAASRCEVLAVGPGCGETPELGETVRRLISELTVPMILDADALNVLAKDLSILKNKQGPIIVTPHIGEMSRLTKLTVDHILAHPIFTARDFAKEWGVITVLKGARTVIALPTGEIYINITGNSGMATAGSGDVLTGIIAGFVAQGLKPEDAAIVGVFVHGFSGDVVAARIGEHGLLAGDLIEQLPYTLKTFYAKRYQPNHIRG